MGLICLPRFRVLAAGCSSAVDGDHGSADEGGGIGQQVGDGVSHFRGEPDAAERVDLGHLAS